jgi:hypothetical protein
LIDIIGTPKRRRMGLVRAEAIAVPEHVHRDDEEVLPVAGALILVVIDVVLSVEMTMSLAPTSLA